VAADIEQLEERLGYSFASRELLEQALTHRSFGHENPDRGGKDYERLEFLGDAVLDLVIGHVLFERFPSLREGDLSMRRAEIVSEGGLAEVARRLELGRWLYLGRGEEQTGGRDKSSILADSCEAVFAAIYLDGGFAAAERAARALFDVDAERPAEPGFVDYKTRLQELIQAEYREPPRYSVEGEEGPDHAKSFEVAVSVQGRELGRATGRSKKTAEQQAAKNALEALEAPG